MLFTREGIKIINGLGCDYSARCPLVGRKGAINKHYCCDCNATHIPRGPASVVVGAGEPLADVLEVLGEINGQVTLLKNNLCLQDSFLSIGNNLFHVLENTK